MAHFPQLFLNPALRPSPHIIQPDLLLLQRSGTPLIGLLLRQGFAGAFGKPCLSQSRAGGGQGGGGGMFLGAGAGDGGLAAGEPGGVGAGERVGGVRGCDAGFVGEGGLCRCGAGGGLVKGAEGVGEIAARGVRLGGTEAQQAGDRIDHQARAFTAAFTAASRAAKLASMLVASWRSWVSMASIRGTMRSAASTAGSVPGR